MTEKHMGGQLAKARIETLNKTTDWFVNKYMSCGRKSEEGTYGIRIRDQNPINHMQHVVLFGS